MTSVLFHLAFPINNIELAKQFYVDGLGCKVGRESRHAVILDFYGHQLVAHMTSDPLIPQKSIYPRHFGLIFTQESDWEAILQRSIDKQLMFYEQPKHRFPGELTEHRTFFIQDPFYNLMEFKFYRHSEAIFGGQALAAVGDR